MVGAGAAPVHLWRDLVELAELGIVERQKSDQPWAETLMRLREGAHNDADLELLESRCISKLNLKPEDPIIRDLPHCFHTNAQVIPSQFQMCISR